jgi:hypothetical protein
MLTPRDHHRPWQRPAAFLLSLALGGWLIGKWGSANAQDVEKRLLDDYQRIELRGKIDLRFEAGLEGSAIIETKRVETGKILTEVEDGRLIIRREKRDQRPLINLERITVYLGYTKGLREIKLQGSGSTHWEQPWKGERLDLLLSGSGDAQGPVAVDRLLLRLRGSGDVRISGRADRATVEVFGAGDVEAGELRARMAELRVKGSGDVELEVREKLLAEVQGSGDVRYGGSPEQVESRIRGSGEVEPLDQ